MKDKKCRLLKPALFKCPLFTNSACLCYNYLTNFLSKGAENETLKKGKRNTLH